MCPPGHARVNTLKIHIKEKSWDIICVSETHLLPHVLDPFVGIPGYNLIRHDTPGNVAKHGVCVYIRESIQVDSVITPVPNMVCFRSAVFDVYCVVVYRPPSNSLEMNACLLELISDLSIDEEVIIAGDFNLPSVDWSTNPPKASSPTDRDVLDAFNALGLSQWVHESTYPRSGNILDLILTSETDRIGLSSVLSSLPGCDHCSGCFCWPSV